MKALSKTDMSAVEELLSSFQLPISDLGDPDITFDLRWVEKELVACIALEQKGKVGLLRSLAVAPHYQGKGLANQLVMDLIIEAKRKGLKALYLLTTTAEHYFLKKGFKLIHRNQLPDSISQTQQVRFLCPSEAKCMILKLDE